MRIVYTAIFCAVMLASCGIKKAANVHQFAPGADAQKKIIEALIQAKDGDTLVFAAGTYDLTQSLTMDGKRNVTLRGAGQDKTIFNFTNQKDGAEGIKIQNCKNLRLLDFAVEESKGDGVKVQGCDSVLLRGLRAEWKGTPDSLNGAYGLYPVTCTNIIVEDCIAKGASDAGIYLGQSKRGIVRRNLAQMNVAGIEIENCYDIDVYENTATGNTGGIFIFDMPGLPIKNGQNIRVYKNKAVDNNHPNFSSPGITVNMVAAGTGMLVMATTNVEIFDNEVTDHGSVGLALASWAMTEKPTTDSTYNWFPSSVSIHNNKFSNKAGLKPDMTRRLGQLLAKIQAGMGGRIPDIAWDGAVHPAKAKEGLKGDDRICLQNNGDIIFFNLSKMNTDAKAMDCSITALPAISL